MLPVSCLSPERHAPGQYHALSAEGSSVSESSQDSATFRSTSDLIPVEPVLDTASAQVLPGDVKGMLQRDLQLSPTSHNSEPPGGQLYAAHSFQQSVTTTTGTTGATPVGAQRMVAASSGQDEQSCRSSLSQQNEELRHSLKAAQEAFAGQQQIMLELEGNLQAMRLRLSNLESSLADSACTSQGQAQSITASARLKELERHENASNQQIAVLQQRVKEQEALNAILTHQLASTQAASEHSASDERLAVSHDTAAALERALQAEQKAQQLNDQLTRQEAAHGRLHGELQVAKQEAKQAAAEAAQHQALLLVVQKEKGFLQEQMALLSGEAEALRRHLMQPVLPPAAVQPPSQNLGPAAPAAWQTTKRECIPSLPTNSPPNPRGGSQSSIAEPMQSIDTLARLENQHSSSPLTSERSLQSWPGEHQPAQKPMPPRRMTDQGTAVGGRQLHAFHSQSLKEQRPAGILTPRNASADILKGLPERPLNAGLMATPRQSPKPYATDLSLKDFMEKTKQLEGRLMEVNAEKDLLEGELARLPGSGRTLPERSRKTAAESRLAMLVREAGTIRMNLKQMGALKL